MKKLALIGLNNSHPYVFGGVVNGGIREVFEANSPGWTHQLFPRSDWEGEFGEDYQFTCAWSRDQEFAGNVARAVKVERVAESLEKAAVECDGAFVLDMWGEYHLEQALPFLEQGKPVFVDKPLAAGIRDARAMLAKAGETGSVLCTCSSNRFVPELVNLKQELATRLGKPTIVTVCSPCWQDLARYAVHGIEIMMEVVSGRPVKSVRNIGTGTRKHLILLEFFDGTCGVIHSWEGHNYSVTVNAENGQSLVGISVNEGFRKMISAVLDSFESGVPVVDYNEAIEVVKVIEAATVSQMQDGIKVELESLF